MLAELEPALWTGEHDAAVDELVQNERGRLLVVYLNSLLGLRVECPCPSRN